MISIRTMARKVSMNKRMTTSCKSPESENKNKISLIAGIGVFSIYLGVKYHYDVIIYEERMIKYEERMVKYRKRQEIDIINGSVTLSRKPRKPQLNMFYL